MSAVVSAGLMMYRMREQRLEVLLAHPGGPYYARKEAGVWTIPKGLIDPGEDALAAAKREFAEETGFDPDGLAGAGGARYVPLGAVKYKNHKIVRARAFAGECDPGAIVSNTFTIEWPRRSGRQLEVAEIDRAAFFDIPAARAAILPAQRRFRFDLEALVDPAAPPAGDGGA
jgi:predicted NUDIX family NTP pyrophosphohydrolase